MTETTWFVRDRGRVRGPFSADQLLQQHQRGQLARFHDISNDRTNWVKAATLLDGAGTGASPTSARTVVARHAPTIPIEALPSAGGTEPLAWTPAADEFALAPANPKAGSAPGLVRLAMILVPCTLILAGLSFVVYLNASDPLSALSMSFEPSANAATIHSTKEENTISRAVGLVVVGVEHKKPDGTHGDLPITTGSCFAISDDGSLLTNRHVVELYDQMSNADDIDQRKLLYVRTTNPGKPTDAREQLLQRLASEMKHTRFEPRIWVFFIGKNGRPEKKVARLVHMCDENEYDMAILKVDRPKADAKPYPYFRLSNSAKKMKRGDEVVALGFPGVTRNPVSDDERVEEALRKQLATRVESIFKDRDFSYLRNAGEVSLDFSEKTGRRWIQHNAAITHGNSGGPLLNPQGLVVGINTLGEQDGSTFRALSSVQLRPIIEEKVKGAVFSDH